jgi:hypothetical protein
VYIKGGNMLATAPHLDSPSAPFFPTAVQWRTDSVSLAAYSHQAGMIISFNNISGYGTDLYVDNINLHGAVSIDTTTTNTGISTILNGENENITIYPNPSKGLLTLSWTNVSKDNINLRIYDVLGENVKDIMIPVNSSSGKASIDASNLNDGMYFIRTNVGTIQMTKLTLQK